jgi:hypothetical protein
MALQLERMGEWVVLAYHTIDNLDALLSDEKLLQVCSILNGDLLCGRLQLAVAMHRLTNHLAVSGGHLRTRTMHSELMLMLSPTRNITEALRLFSVDSTTAPAAASAAGGGNVSAVGGDGSVGLPSRRSQCVVFALHNPQREDIGYVLEHVQGTPVPLSDLSLYADPETVATVYHVGQAEISHCGLEACVVNRIAVADI